MKKQLWGFFFQKDLIFLDSVIPLRCPHLQGTYAFSWLWYWVPLCSAWCFLAKFHSASVSSSTGPFFSVFTYSLGAGSPLVIPAGAVAPRPRPFGDSEEVFPPCWVWHADDCDRNKQEHWKVPKLVNWSWPELDLELDLGKVKGNIPCAALPVLNVWAELRGQDTSGLCIPFVPSVEQACRYKMLLPVMLKDLVAKGKVSSAVCLACHYCPCLCCESSFLSLTFSTNASEIYSFLKVSACCQVTPWAVSSSG